MEETVILEFVVDQSKAQKDLEKTEKALLDTKAAQAQLQKEYKQGEKSQEQYIKENLKLQNTLKREQDQKRTLTKLIDTETGSRNALKLQVAKLTKEYDNLNTETAEGITRQKQLQKELTSLTGSLNKSSKSAGLFKDQIGNYPQSFGDAAKSINIAGVSVGDIGAKLASFANPATAAVGILGALGAAYARSTVGAKDLEFAQNQLSSAVTLTTNAFASLISSSEDGEGIVSQFFDAVLSRISPAISALSKIAAKNIEELQDLEREELSIREGVNNRLEENQELLTEISDEQTDLNKQLELSNAIISNIKQNKAELVDINQKELEKLEFSLGLDKANESIQDSIAQKKLEISKIESDSAKKLKAIEVLQGNINAKIAEQARLEAGVNKRLSNKGTIAAPGISDVTLNEPSSIEFTLGDVKDQKSLAADLLKINEDFYIKDVLFKKKATELKAQYDQQAIDAAANIAGQAASLFDEQTGAFKIFATAQTLISTYSSATKAFDSLAGIPLIGPGLGAAAAALAVAQGLANVARINGVEFAEGGYTGPGTKYQPAGVVHAGEVVWSQRDVAMAGGPMAANAMRPTSGLRGYADGGFVTNQNISSSQQALITANALKNLPPAQVSWTEGRAVGLRVTNREKLAKL
jgi:hypothetical protein